MNFRQFEALYWIARLGGFHAAARHLRTSQPAISARIREMERQLGVTLFDRSGRKVRPTPKGHEMLRYAAQVMAIAAEIQQRVGTREALTRRVRLGVPGIAALTWLPHLLERVERTYPGLVVEFTGDSSEILVEQMQRGLLDVAVLAAPVASPKVTAESLGRVALAWLCSPLLDLPLGMLGGGRYRAVAGDHRSRRNASARCGDGLVPCRGRGARPPSRLFQPADTHRARGARHGHRAGRAVSRQPGTGARRAAADRDGASAAVPGIRHCLYRAIGLEPGGRLVAEMAKALIAQKPDLQAYYSAVGIDDDKLNLSNSEIFADIDNNA
jgi:DNA-binding transcriptional LysR family regulator